jgi:hypothetical protein
MFEYLEIKRLLKRAEVVSHNHGRMVFKLDITTVKKGAINMDQMARHFREIEGIQDLSFDPKENEIELDYDTQKIEPGLLESLVETSKKEAESGEEATPENKIGNYEIKEIPSSPEEIEAIRYENPALAEKIDLIHQLRFILTVHGLKESGINVAPLKGILKKLGLEEYKDILSSQGIASLGQGLLNKVLARALD